MGSPGPLRSPPPHNRQAASPAGSPSHINGVTMRAPYSTKTPSPLNPTAIRHVRCHSDLLLPSASSPFRLKPTIEEGDDDMADYDNLPSRRSSTINERAVTADALHHLTDTVASLTRSLSNRGFRRGRSQERQPSDSYSIADNLASPTSTTSESSSTALVSPAAKRRRPALQKRRSGSRDGGLNIGNFGNLSLDYREREFSQPVEPSDWRPPSVSWSPEQNMEVDDNCSLLETPDAIPGAHHDLVISSPPNDKESSQQMSRPFEMLRLLNFEETPSIGPSSIRSEPERLSLLVPSVTPKRVISHVPARSLSELPSLDPIFGHEGPMEREDLLQWRPELLKMIKGEHGTEAGNFRDAGSRRGSWMTDYGWTFQASLTEVWRGIVPQIFPLTVGQAVNIAEFSSCSNSPPHPGLRLLVQQIIKRSFVHASPLFIQVAHQCHTNTDVNALYRLLNTHSDSYVLKDLNTSIQILSQFTFADPLSLAFSPASIDLAFAAQNLNSGGSRVYEDHTLSRATATQSNVLSDAERDDSADRDLALWLDTRADEIRPGGYLLLSLYVRDGDTDTQQFVTAAQLQSPSDTRWGLFSRIRAVLQRSINILVYEGKISPDLAQQCLSIALWPRSRPRLQGVLQAATGWEVVKLLEVEETTALVQKGAGGETAMWAESGVMLRRLRYEPWVDLQAGVIDRDKYTRCVTEYCRRIYLDNVQRVLAANGKNRHISHLIVTELFDRFADMVDTKRLLEDPKLDVGVIVLRRTLK